MPTPEITYPNPASALRERLLGQRIAPPEKIEIDGIAYYVRAPVLSDRDAIAKSALASMRSKDAKLEDVPMDRMLAASALALVVDERGAAVFQAADFDALREAPVGGWVERLSMAALSKLNPKAIPVGEAQGEASVSASPSSSLTA